VLRFTVVFSSRVDSGIASTKRQYGHVLSVYGYYHQSRTLRTVVAIRSRLAQ
jgi:hypothetical protein